MRKIKATYWNWKLLTILVVLLVLTPLFFVLEGFFAGDNEHVQHVKSFLLKDMVFTTIRMVVGVGAVAVLLGLPTAYFIANFNFPLRNFLRKALLLPVAVPTYIMAFAYASIFSISGLFYKVGALFVDREVLYSWNIDVLTEQWLMLFLGFALFPYVYSASLVSFSIKNKSLSEVAASLGANAWSRFWRVSFPLVLPATLGGVALVTMEVLNDYGAMSYFNVNTITAGIFQVKQMDFSSSMYLSALFFVLILSFFTLYYLIKSYKRATPILSAANYDLIQCKGGTRFLISFVVFIPFFLGFLLPVFELVLLASERVSVLFSRAFLFTALNAIQLALIPSLIIVLIALIILYNTYLNKGFFSRFLAAISTVGYAVPGAIIAVAIMAFVMTFDNASKEGYHFLIDSLILLIFAFVIRFLAVGYTTLESGFNRISTHLPDASRSLGKGINFTLIKVYFPLLKTALLTTLAMVVVDVLKELPITLLLQRFNFNTLATITYEQAKINESVADASPYALLLIFVGTLAVLFLMKDEKLVKK